MQALNCILMSFFSFHFCLNKYFLQYSRLHFIGTWRNRYQKRFPRLSNEFKHTSSDLNASGVSQKNVIIHMDMVISICRAFEYNMLSFFSFFPSDTQFIQYGYQFCCLWYKYETLQYEIASLLEVHRVSCLDLFLPPHFMY